MNRSDAADALKAANLPTLLMVLHHLTGEDRWLRDPYRPGRSPGLDVLDSGGFSEEIQAEIRNAAVDALVTWSEGEPVRVERPDGEHLHRMAEAFLGEVVPVEFVNMISVQMGLGASASREPSNGAAPPKRRPRVGVIGAGVSGLMMARELRDRGIECVLFERSSDLGGCWLDNRYPGCRVDTPSYLYSFSFYKRDWTSYFGTRDEVLDYVRDMAAGLDLRGMIRFQHDIRAARWSSEESAWTLSIATPNGVVQETVDFLVSGIGQLNTPSIPEIEGASEFGGTMFHAGRWQDVDLSGKRVAVVGSGASAMQIVPAIVDQAASLTIYQRSPHWIAPSEQYFTPVDSRLHWLMSEVPFYYSWYRARLAWIINDRNHKSLQIDPNWDGGGRSINAINDNHRRYFTDYLMRELEGRPDLVEKMLPDYPPFGKRMLLDNGWFKAIRKPHVEVVTSGVQRFTRDGIVDSDGTERAVDIVVFATGYKARDFLAEIEIEGKHGKLGDIWGGENARAYMGMTVPGFPNMFVMYGPNTNLGHGGSYSTIAEMSSHYIGELIGRAARDGICEIDVRPEVHEEYNRKVDEAHAKMIWTVPGVKNWYRTAQGRVIANIPWRIMDFWKMTRRVDLADYHIREGTETVIAETA